MVGARARELQLNRTERVMACFIDFSTYPVTKEQKRLNKIWCSGEKRFKCSRFRCDYCGKFRNGQSYSVVDGCKSCPKCDEQYNDNQ